MSNPAGVKYEKKKKFHTILIISAISLIILYFFVSIFSGGFIELGKGMFIEFPIPTQVILAVSGGKMTAVILLLLALPAVAYGIHLFSRNNK